MSLNNLERLLAEMCVASVPSGAVNLRHVCQNLYKFIVESFKNASQAIYAANNTIRGMEDLLDLYGPCVEIVKSIQDFGRSGDLMWMLWKTGGFMCTHLSETESERDSCLKKWKLDVHGYLEDLRRVVPGEVCQLFVSCDSKIGSKISTRRQARQATGGDGGVFTGIGSQLGNLLDSFIGFFINPIKRVVPVKPTNSATTKSTFTTATPSKSSERPPPLKVDPECDLFELHFWEALQIFDLPSPRSAIPKICDDCTKRITELKLLVDNPLVEGRCGSRIAERFCLGHDSFELTDCQNVMLAKVTKVVVFIGSQAPFNYCKKLNFCTKIPG